MKNGVSDPTLLGQNPNHIMEALKKKFGVYQNKLLSLLTKTHKNRREKQEIDQTLGGGESWKVWSNTKLFPVIFPETHQTQLVLIRFSPNFVHNQN